MSVIVISSAFFTNSFNDGGKDPLFISFHKKLKSFVIAWEKELSRELPKNCKDLVLIAMMVNNDKKISLFIIIIMILFHA